MDITISSNIADTIIAVINSLCEKFGIVFDWSAENILPKVQDLITRFAQYRTSMFLSFLIGALVLLVLSFVWYKLSDEETALVFVVIFSILFFIFGILCAVHIPRCVHLPELELYRWASNNGFLNLK